MLLFVTRSASILYRFQSLCPVWYLCSRGGGGGAQVHRALASISQQSQPVTLLLCGRGYKGVAWCLSTQCAQPELAVHMHTCTHAQWLARLGGVHAAAARLRTTHASRSTYRSGGRSPYLKLMPFMAVQSESNTCYVHGGQQFSNPAVVWTYTHMCTAH